MKIVFPFPFFLTYIKIYSSGWMLLFKHSRENINQQSSRYITAFVCFSHFYPFTPNFFYGDAKSSDSSVEI